MIANVINYGAMGDGVTDDTAAIQRALTDATDGDVIHFPSGHKYMVNGTVGIDVPGERELALAGATVALFPGSGPKACAFQTVPGSKNIRFVGGTIAGDMSAVPGSGFRIGLRADGVEGLDVIGTRFEFWKTDAVWIGGNAPSKRVRLDSVTCDTFGRNGLSIVNADGVQLARCHFWHAVPGSNPGAGIDVEPNPYERVTDLEIYACSATDCEVGFYLHPGRGIPGERYRVYGCAVTGARRIGVVLNSAVDCCLVDNRVILPAPVAGQPLPIGFSIGGATAQVPARDVVLSNNRAEGGQRCFVFAGLRNVSAIGNSGRLETVGLGVTGETFLTRNGW